MHKQKLTNVQIYQMVKDIVLTTNLTFSIRKMGRDFKDLMERGAIVDKSAYRAHILDMSREISYKLEDTINWLNNPMVSGPFFR